MKGTRMTGPGTMDLRVAGVGTMAVTVERTATGELIVTVQVDGKNPLLVTTLGVDGSVAVYDFGTDEDIYRDVFPEAA
jgi:hypothetical protein